MLLIGLDIGTTGTKALLVDSKGSVLGKGYQGYKIICDGNRVEQRAEDWWEACIIAVRKALQGYNPNEVAAISLSTQGASMVALDAHDRTIGNAITWMDTRAENQKEYIKNTLSDSYIYHTTGWRTSSVLDASKILYMKQNTVYSKAVRYLSTLEYVNLRLTGNAVIDPTNAAMRQVYNVKNDCWDNLILNTIGAAEKELPVILRTGEYVGSLLETAAEALGLPGNVRVFNGAHDQYCASIGSGAVTAGDMLISTGTTWVVMGITTLPLFTNTYIASCTHPARGVYGAMASLIGAGTSFQWLKDNFLRDISYEEIGARCCNAQNKDENLFFVPWMHGAAYPFWNPSARGGFLGLGPSTDVYDMALCVMESAVFNAKSAVIDYAANGCPVKSIKTMGGATKSELWMSLLQAVMDVPVSRMEEPDTCAMGAAIIAACAMGLYKDYAEAAGAMAEPVPVGETNMDYRFYSQKYERYCSLLDHVIQFYGGAGA